MRRPKAPAKGHPLLIRVVLGCLLLGLLLIVVKSVRPLTSNMSQSAYCRQTIQYATSDQLAQPLHRSNSTKCVEALSKHRLLSQTRSSPAAPTEVVQKAHDVAPLLNESTHGHLLSDTTHKVSLSIHCMG